MSSIFRVTSLLTLLMLAIQISAIAQTKDKPAQTREATPAKSAGTGAKPKTSSGAGTAPSSQAINHGTARPAPQSETVGTKERPQAAPLRIERAADEPLDPAMEQVLLDWETESKKIQTLQCTFTKYRYNHKWRVEYRSEGEVKFQAPDRGAYSLTPTVISSSMKGRTKDQKGQELTKPYLLKPDDAQNWYCNGKQVFDVNRANKTFEAHAIPKEIQGQNIVNSPLPFLFGMKAEEAKRRFSMKLLSTNVDRHEIMIRATPKTAQDAANYQSAVVLLDSTNFTPKAVKLFDPTGNEEIVHSFQKMQLNRQLTSRAFEPNLAGLKQAAKDVAKAPGTPAAAPVRTATPGTNRKG